MPPTMRTMTRVLRALLDVVFVGLVATILAAVVAGRMVPLTGHPTLVVAGGSMAPAIGVGSVVIVDPVDPTDLAVGDVVSVREAPDRTTYTHRITRIVERDGVRWLETKGDANTAPDPSITPASTVIGRVAFALPLLGFVIALMAQPTGVVSVLALAVALMVARSLVSSATDAGGEAGIPRTDAAHTDPARTDPARTGSSADSSTRARAGTAHQRAAGARATRRGPARSRAIRAG
jgi:signal peptidase